MCLTRLVSGWTASVLNCWKHTAGSICLAITSKLMLHMPDSLFVEQLWRFFSLTRLIQATTPKDQTYKLKLLQSVQWWHYITNNDKQWLLVLCSFHWYWEVSFSSQSQNSGNGMVSNLNKHSKWSHLVCVILHQEEQNVKWCIYFSIKTTANMRHQCTHYLLQQAKQDQSLQVWINTWWFYSTFWLEAICMAPKIIKC